MPLTLIALDGLSYAVEASVVAARDPRIARSARWLAEQDDLPVKMDATRAYVLTRLEGARHAAKVRALVASVPAADAYSTAMVVLAARHAGIIGEPGLRARIEAMVDASGRALAQFADYRPDREQWGYPLRTIGVAAVLAHAASLDPAGVDTVAGSLLRLVSSAPVLSTFDRAALLLHSQWLIERDAKRMRAMKPPGVTSNGDELAGVRFRPRGAGLAADLDPAVRKIEVASTEGVATLRARLSVPLDQVRSRDEGMSVSRDYQLLTPDGVRPLAAGETVPHGALVFVRLTLDATEAQQRSAYYVVEDQVPAGFSPIEEDKVYRGAPYDLPLSHEALKRRALSPERATFFFEEPTWWSKTPRSIGYVIRADYPGRYAAPPASVADMYAPAIRGRSSPAVLSIGPVGSR